MLDVDIEFARGAFHLQIQHQFADGITGICGPSGAGKSTLLALIAGLLRPQQGRIRFNGDVLADCAERVFVPAYRRHIALVFQDGQLFPHLTVRANLQYGQRADSIERRVASLRRIAELLEIDARLDRRPDQLSGGERQRVALGRALLSSPRLLLLDEPLSSLDARLKQQILPFLRRVRDEMQLPMLYVSHSPEEVAYLTDRVLNIDRGRLVT